MITKKIKSAWKTRVNGFSRNKLALGLLAAKTSRIETWDWMLREVTICPNKITCKNANERARQQSRLASDRQARIPGTRYLAHSDLSVPLVLSPA